MILVAVAVLLVLPASVWAWMHLSGSRPSAKMLEAKELAAKAFENRDNMTEEQRRAAFADMRKTFEGLSESERRELRREGMAERQRREQEEMTKFMAMSEQERAAYCLKKAQEEASRFDRRAAEQAKNGDNPGGNGSPSSSNNPPPPGGGPGDSGRPPGGFRNATPEQREQFRKQMLDNTTPEQRAQRTIYRSALAQAIGQQNVVRQQQGLPLVPAPGTRRF
jgi:hypothetical protein